MTDSERFARLFRGNERSFGVYFPKDGRMQTNKTKYTLKEVDDHLYGKIGLGVVPIRDDGTCYFGVIDVDCHEDGKEIDPLPIYDKITQLKLPLTVCRSKSGGAHLYLFGSEPLRASKVRSMLSKWANDLGYPGVEIFPKQSYLKDGALGNWINLPYFGEPTRRYAIEDRKESTLDFFLMNAESKTIDNTTLIELYTADHPDAPPCVQKILIGGVGSGARNEALYNITIYLKKAFPDDFKDRAFDMNAKVFTEPLEHGEARKTIQSAGRRTYKYKCKEEPCVSLCDSKTCLNRKYGITKGDAEDLKKEENLPEFTNLKKFMSDPVRWELAVNGVRIVMETGTLLEFRKLREKIAEKITMLIPMINPKRWNTKLEALMSEAEIVDTPDDASTSGVIRSKLTEFIKKADITTDGDRNALLRGLPVAQDRDGKKVVYFRGPDFVDHLKRTRSEELKGINLWLALSEAGVNHTRIRINKKSTNVWYTEIVEEEKLEIPKNLEPEF